jgi:nucleoid-associated protein YgaU
MSVGSKVVLLVSLGFIGLLIWYYGATPVPSDSSEPGAESTNAPVVSAVTVQTPSPRTARTTPAARPAPATTPPPKAPAAPVVATTVTPPARPAAASTAFNELTMGEPRAPRRIATIAPLLPTVPRAPLAPTKRATVTTVARTAEVPSRRSHTVRPGDTLSELAEQYYGSHQRWSVIVNANPGLDPDRLRVGQTLTIPPQARQVKPSTPARAATPVPPGARSHTVSDGDSLSSIADRYYGHEKHWTRVFEANTTTLSGDPDRLRIGMVLVVPR